MGASTPYGVFGNRHRLCLFLTPQMTIMFISNPLVQQSCLFPKLEFWMKKNTIKKFDICLFPYVISNPPFLPSMSKSICHLTPHFFPSLNECSVGHNVIISVFHYSSVLNRSHRATFWHFDPNYSLPNVTPKKG